MQVEITRHNRAVQLILNLSAGALDVYPDKDLSPAKHKTQGFGLVIVEEVACIDVKTQQRLESPQEPASFYLLSTLAINDIANLHQIVHFYGLRWRIERLHFTLKSGA